MFVLNFCQGGNELRDQMFQAIIQANMRYQSKVLSKRVDLFYFDCAMNFGTKTE